MLGSDQGLEYYMIVLRAYFTFRKVERNLNGEISQPKHVLGEAGKGKEGNKEYNPCTHKDSLTKRRG